MDKIPVIVIVGPTASGKTDLAVECALHFHTEVISADSMQIYKGMQIATAKPTKEEMRNIPHHLIDFLPPESTYSVAEYVEDAKQKIAQIYEKGKIPILAGGTGLYIDSLIENVRFTEVPTDFALRAELQEKANEICGEKMLEELKKFDPESAEQLHPANLKRIIRAFEVYQLTGIPLSEHVKNSKLEPSDYRPIFIGINYRSRETLYNRINLRVDKMLDAGLLEEAKQYFDFQNGTGIQAIGYKELKPYFDGILCLEDCIENLKKVTRHYAKRQLTWFRKNERIFWIYPDDYETRDAVYQTAIEYIEKELYNAR